MQFLIIKNQKGYTLIELILTMVVLAILGYAAIPNSPSLAPINLDSAAQKIKSDIRYAQNLATTTGDSHGFRATGNTTYEIYNVATGLVVNSPTTQAAMQEDLSSSFQGVTFQSPSYSIIFNSFGQPTTGGGTSVTLVSGAQTKSVQVTATTGYVNVL